MMAETRESRISVQICNQWSTHDTSLLTRSWRWEGVMPRNIYPFDTKPQVVRFAKIFLRRRVRGFKKDIGICLTADARGNHAFMPGLMTCLSFLDLLSGLYAGNVRSQGLEHFLRFMNAFASAQRYQDYNLRILYVAFRHKLAHLGQPIFVLNTANDTRLKQQSLRLTWRISSDAHEPPLRLTKLRRSRLIRNQPIPWRMRVDHYMLISIRTLAGDAIDMSRAYLERLEAEPDLWKGFQSCMREFYQQ